jgi:predicted nucleic acid-binding protein
MIVVDSSVWIDYFRGTPSAEANRLDDLLGVEPLPIGDLILAEVLQGFDSKADFQRAMRLLMSGPLLALGGAQIAVEAAKNFRQLRKLGVTVRKTIETIIATHCLVHDHWLLYSDRDFDPFVKHLSLRSAMAGKVKRLP